MSVLGQRLSADDARAMINSADITVSSRVCLLPLSLLFSSHYCRLSLSSRAVLDPPLLPLDAALLPQRNGQVDYQEFLSMMRSSRDDDMHAATRPPPGVSATTTAIA